MDAPRPPPPLTPKKSSRPKFSRSQSASADLSPPRPSTERTGTSATQLAVKKLHIPRPHATDRARRGGERVAQVVADHSPVSAVTEKIRGHERSDSQKRSALNSRQSNIEPPAPAAEAEAAPAKLPSKHVSIADVEKERHRRYARNTELQNTVETLSGLARDSTRRVDSTYYSILEKATSLRSTITALQDLSKDSKKLLGEFEDDASRVNEDLGEQVSTFRGFESQNKRVSSLEDRIKVGMEKTEGLSGRLEVARKRVELWEARENEWQAFTSRRVKIGWGIFAAVAVLLLLLLGIRQLYTVGNQLKPRTSGPMARINDTLLEQIRSDFTADVDKSKPIKPLKMKKINAEKPMRRLRVLDEL